MDEERRRLARASEAEGDVEALVRQAVAFRRAGELEPAHTALTRALELEPAHATARALHLLVEVALGRRTRGSFGDFRHETKLTASELVRRLDPAYLGAVALSALDPEQGPIDAEAIGALVDAGRVGLRALLEALARVQLASLPKQLRIAVGLRAKQIAGFKLAPDEIPAELRRRTLAALASPSAESRADWILLAGALGLREARETIEGALSAPEDTVRNGAVWALELLADPASRPALEHALARTKSKGDRRLIERALAALA